MPGFHWMKSEIPPELDEGIIHLWRVRLDGVQGSDEDLWALLSPQEEQRARGFRLDQHRWRFVRSHALMRRILARYIGCAPADLKIEVGARGKPFLSPGQEARMRFNLSHSGDLMLFALALDADVGVDVEIINPQVEWRQVARPYFSDIEFEGLERIRSAEAQVDEFYRIWTLKEAYLKAVGDGLAGGLQTVVVNPDTHSPQPFVALPGSNNEERRWQVMSFRPVSGALGAVVIRREGLNFHLVALEG